MSHQPVRTPAQARQWLDRHGVPVSEWARQNGFEPAVVFGLLSGRTRGRWGQAYEAAVKLGLRPAPATDEKHPLALEGGDNTAPSRSPIPIRSGEASMT